MIVFKFGGASIHTAQAVINLTKILKTKPNNAAKVLIIVSAMGKNTSALEQLIDKYFHRKSIEADFIAIKAFHQNIIDELFPANHPIFILIGKLFSELYQRLSQSPSTNFDYEYDQIVVFGELFSSLIVSEFLSFVSINNKLVDIRQVLKTDATHREAHVDWELSQQLSQETFNFQDTDYYLTQGFIAQSAVDNSSTTLGKEGSDFSAAALAYLLNASEVVVWKDVAGVFNADPKSFQNAQKLKELSFQEAIELSYYGAKIIHPKTIKPLQNKNIPLTVRSFVDQQEKGTKIWSYHNLKQGISPLLPVFIIKNKQILISISPFDFSFIAEENLGKIFSLLAQHRIRVNLMQNSAISFSISVDFDRAKVLPFIDKLQEDYKVLYNTDLELLTIRHYTNQAIQQFVSGRKVYVQQKSRTTARFVLA